MGADIYKAKYKYVFGPITLDQFYFIDNNIDRSDDGTYGLSWERYQELKQKMGEFEKQHETELRPLFSMFSREIRKEKGHFSFRIFV